MPLMVTQRHLSHIHSRILTKKSISSCSGILSYSAIRWFIVSYNNYIDGLWWMNMDIIGMPSHHLILLQNQFNVDLHESCNCACYLNAIFAIHQTCINSRVIRSSEKLKCTWFFDWDVNMIFRRAVTNVCEIVKLSDSQNATKRLWNKQWK